MKDLKQRGLLDDTLVIWFDEFARTVYSQGSLTKDNCRRDFHLTAVHGNVVKAILPAG